MFTINKWKESFENADMRKRQRLGWFLAPSGTDSRGYRKLMRSGSEGIMAYGVFMALCQYMATLPKETRGSFLNSDGTPMDIEDISEITRIKVADIQHATGTLVACGWLTLIDSTICHQSATNLPEPADHFPDLSKEKEREREKREGEETPSACKGENLPFDSESFSTTWAEWKKYRAEIRKKLTPSTIAKQLNTLSKLTETDAITVINTSIENGWQGLFPERLTSGNAGAFRNGSRGAPANRNAGTANEGQEEDYADLG